MGSHLQNTETHYMNASTVTSMARDVSKSLQYYGGKSQGAQWLPVNQLFRIVTRDSVFRALRECRPKLELSETKLWKYAEDICPRSRPDGSCLMGARSMFAILTILERVNEIIQFIDLNLSDYNLPFVPDANQPSLDGQLFPKNPPPGFANQIFGRHWTLRDWGAFERYQKTMRSPFFDIGPNDKERNIHHYELEPDTVLPFIKEFPATSSDITSYSKVQRVQIHMHHHTMHKGVPDENPFFAVKELLPEPDDKMDTSREKNFRAEVRALAKTVGLSSHDHVIKLLATWRKGDSWSMLFPWAISNLKDYWKRGEPERSPEFVKWISTQCRGLAEGLQKIHKSPSDHADHAQEYGIHGDIKPENILLFHSDSNPFGIMVISDFGYTRFHRRNTRSNTPAAGYSPTHRAPELDLEKFISRSYDMWTFGCVFLEFITWYLMGPEGIGEFVGCRTADDTGAPIGIKEDKFFIPSIEENGEKEATVKPSVNDWIDGLRRQPYCGGYFRDFLDLIVKDLLQPKPGKRESCANIAGQLRELEHRCKIEPPDMEYLMGQVSESTTARSLSRTKQHSQQSDAEMNARAYSPLLGSLCDETWGPKSDRGSLNCASYGEMENIADIFSRDGPAYETAQKVHRLTTRSLRMELKAQSTERTPLITKIDSCLPDDTRPTLPGAQRLGEASEGGACLRTRDRPFEAQEMSPRIRARDGQSHLSTDGRHGDRASDSRSIEYKRPGSFLSVYSDGHWCGLEDVFQCCFASSENSTSSQDLDS
ncbi:kinase-like domain-containing protein [Colletotrichum acutatum]|uniref:Kinase-like domain-containing protein n=1 Tax=Glomerella acutata TaxID=27357 RepID=A0AAD8ULR3_GLOAC|nr:kinase-like domain-containing protein [Colletotrichum acutatum]KAK1723671.1 kinase-like domain-containing protein [Colletotrichum acutatum]